MPFSTPSRTEPRIVLCALAVWAGTALAQTPPAAEPDAGVPPPAAVVRPSKTPAQLLAEENELKARTETELAQRAYDLGRFREAISHYAAAYEAMPLPALLFNLGQCHRHLQEHPQAAFFYRRYLDLSPAAPNAPLTRELLAEVEQKASGTPAPTKSVERPIHQRWWVWAGAGAVLAGAAAAAIVASQPPEPSLGTVDGRP